MRRQGENDTYKKDKMSQEPDSNQLGFLDLPAELRNVIYEELTSNALLTGPKHTNRLCVAKKPDCLMQTNNQIRGEYYSTLLANARIELAVQGWNFHAVQAFIEDIQRDPTERKAMQTNTRITIVLRQEDWKEDHLYFVQAWLDFACANLKLGLDYKLKRPSTRRYMFSRSSFLRKAGYLEILRLRRKFSSDDRRREELSKILRAIDHEATIYTHEQAERFRRSLERGHSGFDGNYDLIYGSGATLFDTAMAEAARALVDKEEEQRAKERAMKQELDRLNCKILESEMKARKARRRKANRQRKRLAARRAGS